MTRRRFLTSGALAAGTGLLGVAAPAWAQSLAQRAAGLSDRVLVLVELKGGNDGLNTVVPYQDDTYYRLRDTIAIRREDVLPIDSRVGLHPALADLLPLWEKGELAVVQGVGYPQPNLSHFRSIEIWDTASKSTEYLGDGWLTRAFAQAPVPKSYAADGIVVVTDFRQSDHFEQLFLTVRKWFAAKSYRVPELHHVTFGAVTGEDGKALKTRSGDVIRLKALLDEAVDRAFAIVAEKNPDLPEAERREIARSVGIGAVQYADLAQNRSSNYVFSWDKMLALDGNTAPYLLYAVARIHSIFRKLGIAPGDASTESMASMLETPAELALARKLVKFSDGIRLATDTLRPHFLCLYLYELAGEFSAFYSADKVAVDDPAIRARRLLLCARTLVTLETGLHLLGLRTLMRM